MELRPGTRVLGRYIVERLIAEGGMGQIYRGKHEFLGLPVALKVLTEDRSADLAARFEREAMLMAKVNHPNVVTILDYGFLDDGIPCIAMEFVQGEALDQRIARRGALPWTEAAAHMAELLGGLAAIHAMGVLHRDLKPSNIVVAPGPPEVLKLIDFGIATRTAPDRTKYTQTGVVIGTPAYMSPEQLLSFPLDERSDLYSAGLIFYQLLTGELPFPGEKLTSVMRRIKDPVPRPVAPAMLPKIPYGIQRVLVSVLDPDTGARPASAAELQRTIRGIATGEVVIEEPRGEAELKRQPTMQLDAASARTVAMPATQPHPAGRVTGPITSAKTVAHRTGFPLPDREEPEPPPFEPPPAPERRRFLVAAKLPPSRLANQAEARSLAELAGRRCRCFKLGAQFWLAILSAKIDPAEAAAAAGEIAAAVVERYGDLAKVEWCLVDDSFVLTAASFTGAAPMPEALEGLIGKLTS